MDFNIPPINPSGVNPINPSSDPSNGSYTPGERAIYDAMEEYNAELQAALKEGPNADLTKLIEAAKRLQQLVMSYSFLFPNDRNNPVLLALYKVGDGTDGSGGYFQDLMAACASGDEDTIKSDFSTILGSSDIQNQIQDSFNILHQTYPPPSSNYNATQQAFLDLTAFLQQAFNATNPPIPNNDPTQKGLGLLCQNLAQLQSDLENSGDNMYNTFMEKAPPLIIQLIQDGSSGGDISDDISNIKNNWSSVNAGIQNFLNTYPLPR